MQALLKHVIEARQTLSLDQARTALELTFTSKATEPQTTSDLQLAALLGAIAARGETPAELAGFAQALRAAALPFPLPQTTRDRLIDACGTGGDAANTFNISTAASLVAAAAGATVAKHGNRAVTSRSGSADVLEALGIPISLTPAQAAAALQTHRFAFLHAPAHHPALRAVMPVRRALGVRTAFNLVGPLANPAGAPRQLIGVPAPHLVPVVAEALQLLGAHRALVVFGHAPTPENPHAGLDELSLSGTSHLAHLHNGAISFSTLEPETLNLPRTTLASLQGGDAQTNAAILRSVFAGQPGPRRHIVLLNAAAILWIAGLAPDLPASLHLATRTIDSGAVTHLLTNLQHPA